MKTGVLCLIGLAALASRPELSPALTIVVDVKSAAQPSTTDENGYTVGSLNYAGFGFNTQAEDDALDASILQTLRDDYYNIPTQATLPESPIPAGFQLDIDFVLGDIGRPPSNRDRNFFYAQIGSKVTSTTALGVAGISRVRQAGGEDGYARNRATVCSVFSDNINALGGLTPGDALTCGDLTYSTFALTGTLAHEIAHTLSLNHISKAGSIQPNGLPPLMGTGAIDLPTQDRIGPREFSLSGVDGERGNTPVFQIAQLVSAVGLREAPEPTCLAIFALVGIGPLRRSRRALAGD